MIFIICTEFLALKVKEEQNILGFELPNKKVIKISQFADDTCVYLKNMDQIESCINTINIFSNITGLKLNLEKTEGLRLGSNQERMPCSFGIQWPKTPIRYLGIYIGKDYNKCKLNNWTFKIEKMQKLIDSW